MFRDFLEWPNHQSWLSAFSSKIWHLKPNISSDIHSLAVMMILENLEKVDFEHLELMVVWDLQQVLVQTRCQILQFLATWLPMILILYSMLVTCIMLALIVEPKSISVRHIMKFSSLVRWDPFMKTTRLFILLMTMTQAQTIQMAMLSASTKSIKSTEKSYHTIHSHHLWAKGYSKHSLLLTRYLLSQIFAVFCSQSVRITKKSQSMGLNNLLGSKMNWR